MKSIRKKILISAPYMHRERAKVEALLGEYPFDVDWIAVEERLEEHELLLAIGEYQGLICGDDRITKKVIDAAKNLSVVVKWGTGIDSIDSAYAMSKGIKVFRTPGAFTEPVSDSVLALMLSEVRALFRNNRVVKEGRWDKPQGYTLREKIIGIIGFGDIGQAVARKLLPFGPRVLVNDVVAIEKGILESLNCVQTTKEEIFAECDIITLHADLNPTSEYLLDEKAFKCMKKNPFIINTARGPLIREKVLIEALENGTISGVGIDVFEHEPLPAESPLRSMENVIASCHNTNSSPQCWTDVHIKSIEMLYKGLFEK